MSESEFRQYLEGLRDEALSWADFESSVPRAVVSEFISRGALLRLYSGNFSSAFLEALPVCEKCAPYIECDGLDFSAFDGLSNTIERMLEKLILLDATKPSWFKTPSNVLGGEGFVKCKACSSIWWLIIPERSQLGHCRRIG